MQARGELVGFLDSDNEWLPYKLELQLRLFAKSPPDLGVVYGGYRQVFWDGRPPTFVAPRHRGNIFEQALKEWIADTNTMLIRKDVLVRVGMWDTRVSAYQEWDMCIRLAKQVAFDFVDQPLAVYHVHEGDTISKNLKLSAQGRLDIAEIHREDILRRCGKQVLSQHFLNAGHEFVCASDFQTARLCFKKALKACPTSLRVWKHLIPSQFGEQVYLASMKLKQSLRQGRSAPVKC
jgi:GT2 family glycosyltransferase